MSDLSGVYNDGKTIIRKRYETYSVTIIYSRTDGFTGRKGSIMKETSMNDYQVRRLIDKYGHR